MIEFGLLAILGVFSPAGSPEESRGAELPARAEVLAAPTAPGPRPVPPAVQPGPSTWSPATPVGPRSLGTTENRSLLVAARILEKYLAFRESLTSP
jgi:hypothetical protein